MRRAIALAMVLLLAGCGSGEVAEEDVSTACAEAFSDYATALIKDPDMDEVSSQVATLEACGSKGEWMTAAKAQQFGGSVLFDPGVDMDKVWQAFCSGNEETPACA